MTIREKENSILQVLAKRQSQTLGFLSPDDFEWETTADEIVRLCHGLSPRFMYAEFGNDGSPFAVWGMKKRHTLREYDAVFCVGMHPLAVSQTLR